MSEIIPKDNIEEIVNKQKISEAARDEGEYLVFPLEGKRLGLTKFLMDDGARKDQMTWWWKKGECIVPNVQNLFSFMQYYYRNRDNTNSAIKTAISSFRKDFAAQSRIHTGTRVKYGRLQEVAIEHLLPNNQIKQYPVNFQPVKTWTPLLAKEQPPTELGSCEQIPDTVKPFLEALLGEGYEEAGPILQYIAPRKNGNLLPVYLKLSDARPKECSVAFSVYNDTLFLDATIDPNIEGYAPGIIEWGI